MKRKVKLLTLILFGLFGLASANAQDATSSSGGNANGSGGSVSYTVGQVVYTTNSDSTGSLAQGVQQPYEISIVNDIVEFDIDLTLSAYPNPATNYLMLQIENYNNENFYYKLIDITGRVLESKKVVGSNNPKML